MNNADKEYLRIAKEVFANGRTKKNRTGTDTIGIFGAQARFNLADGFPLLTTKKVFFKGITHELLWFLSGSTNIKYLVDNDVHIWDGNCFDKYKKSAIADLNKDLFKDKKDWPDKVKWPIQEEFIESIKTNEEFAKRFGDLGEGTYGGMWRAFPYAEYYELPRGCSFAGSPIGHKLSHVDQIQKVLDKLKTNPDDRRLIVSAWHPYWVDNCALPPCHCLFQFHTEELTLEERAKIYYGKSTIPIRGLAVHVDESGNWTHGDSLDNEVSPSMFRVEDQVKMHESFTQWGVPKRRLNCQLYQRSADLGLGVPFNIASYALLLAMVAQVSGMIPGEFIWSGGDVHIYENHIDAVKLQALREPRKLPKLILNPEVKNLFDFKYEDIKIEGYDPHPAIKMEMAV